MKKYILLLIAACSIISCEKTLPFDDEGLANQLVLNSIISSNKDFTASLTKTRSILENSYSGGGLMADGTMDIYLNGELIKSENSPTGYFSTTGIKPKAGDSFRIVMNSYGKQLEAETTIPQKAEVLSVDTTTVINKYNSKSLLYKATIKDLEGDDYYRILITQESLTLNKNSDGKGTKKYFLNTSERSIISDNPVFNSVYNNFGGDVFDTGPNNEYNIFPDDYFEGKNYVIQFNTNNYGYGFGYGYYPDSYNPSYGENGNSQIIYIRNVVHIQHLSKEFYTYLKYLKLYFHYQGNPFAEPVPVYSNIKNGIGIFAGLNDDARFTFEKIYRPFSMDTITVEDGNYGNGYYYGSNGGN
jgi:hypothetical protein